MSSVKIALVAAAALIAVAVGVLLSRSPPVVAGTDLVPAGRVAALSRGGDSTCQRVTTVPQGTSAIRVSLGAGVGPSVRVTVSSGSRLVTQGEHPAGWGLHANVTVPVTALSNAVGNALVCTTIGPAVEPVKAFGVLRTGSPEEPTLANVALRLEYLRPGPKSWWSRAPSVSYHLGLGRAVSGTWLAFLALLLALAAGGVALRLAWREIR